ncbi:MAG TPA: hypothetical protein VN780_02025 [Candidatus Eisenbacteria bacterium]|jgi:hypothetical protein|nr:hypothetical protein [Candidatus Eisenbacteria bacterium]
MKTVHRFLAAVIVLSFLSPGGALAAVGPKPEAFMKLQSMVGHWEGQSKDQKSTLDIELTAGGSAILERSHQTIEGKPVEMTTVYYLDGDQVQLTHYCMAGNQPTMRGTYAPETKTLTFDFVGATNLKSPDDGHMHHAVYVFLDDNHIKQTWTFRKNQKDTFSEEMVYARK